MSVIELKRKARKRFAPKPQYTDDDLAAAWAYGFSEAQADQSEWNLVSVRRAAHRPFGSGRKIPFGQFGPARDMVRGLVKQEYITAVIQRDPGLEDEIALHLEEPSEREIAHAMGLCNVACKEVGALTKCVPSDTYRRYMRELRRQQESSNRDVLSS